MLSFEASGGGTVLAPQFASSGNLTVNLGAGGSISTLQFTNITGASLYASGGAILSLPNVVNYQPPAVCETIFWQANGAGSQLNFPALTNVTGNTACSQLTVQALNGGVVSLSQVKADLGGTMTVQSDGTGSKVDLSLLATNAGTLSFEASSGGTIPVPKLSTSGNLSLTLGAGGSISTAQFTNINEASLSASGGVVLSFPNVVSYQPPDFCEDIIWQANGAGSEINLSGLTNVTGTTVCGQLLVQAIDGGTVLLNHAKTVLGGTMTVQANGTNSVVDLSLLAGNAGTLNLSASSGGTVLVPQLANGGLINLTLGGGGFISTAQFTNITGASLFVSAGATLSLRG